jgi:hypothetical protein
MERWDLAPHIFSFPQPNQNKAAPQHCKYLFLADYSYRKVVDKDPDPDWIRIQ